MISGTWRILFPNMWVNTDGSTGFGGARSAQNSAGRSNPTQTNLASFEVKMADFPELAGVPLSRAGTPLIQKQCWGTNPTSVSPQIQTSASPRKVSCLLVSDGRLHTFMANAHALLLHKLLWTCCYCFEQTGRKGSPPLPDPQQNASDAKPECPAASPGGLITLKVCL